jgi:hypothetical protein
MFGVLLLAQSSRCLVCSHRRGRAVPETPIPLLVPPDLPPLPRGGPLHAAPLPRARSSADECGPVVVGAAAVDGSGRVRERAVLAALGWDTGDMLDVLIVRDIASCTRRRTGACGWMSAARSPCPAGAAVIAEYPVRAGQAACSYSCRIPPRRSRLRMSRSVI